METQKLLKKWKAIRDKYLDGIERRRIQVEVYGKKGEDPRFKAWEIKISRELKKLRNDLAKRLPENFPTHRRRSNHYSNYGDNGLLVCPECHGIFKARSTDAFHSFESCEKHQHYKRLGFCFLTITSDMFPSNVHNDSHSFNQKYQEARQ